MDVKELRRVLVLINPKSGVRASFNEVQRALDRWWDRPGIDLSYQFTKSIDDGLDKVHRAIEHKTDTILVVGGDGTVNTIGRTLVGSDVALGVIPHGSGNGFARHFEIPLSPARAVEALAKADPRSIDVGVADDTPFLVTCSMAWDASIVRSFEKSPVRGIVPYIFAGFNEFLQYSPQWMRVELDDGETLEFTDALVFTVANLTQFGGGARIAPQADPTDGRLELVVARREDTPALIANLARFFDGTINRIPQVLSRRFRSMTVHRQQASDIQMDGERFPCGTRTEFRVIPGALRVLVPALTHAG